MPAESLDELKKKFIVDAGELDAQALKDSIEKLMQYCKVSSNGRVMMSSKNLTDQKKVGIVAVARLLAHRLDAKVSEVVSDKEISDYTGIKVDSVHSRAKSYSMTEFFQDLQRGSTRRKREWLPTSLSTLKRSKQSRPVVARRTRLDLS